MMSMRGETEEAARYISTLSDGMKNFVISSYENVLASYALAMTSEEELGEEQYLYATSALKNRAYTPTVGLGSYKLPVYEGEFKEECEEALEKILNRAIKRENPKTRLFGGSLASSRRLVKM